MAVSKNDPDNWPHDVYDDFPEPKGKTLTRTVFQWLTVTVDRVWSGGTSYGIKFVEDTAGDIWNISGQYNEELFKFEPYSGYQYQPGEKVDAQLSLRTYKKNDGSDGVGRSITKIRMNNEYSNVAQPASEAPPAEQPAAEQEEYPIRPVAAEGYLTLDQKIAKAQCLNIIKDFHLAGFSEDIGLSPDASKEIVRNESMRLAQGKAVDLSYLSPLVAVAIENGGIVLEITDSSAPDFEDAPEDENVEELPW